MAGLKYGSWGPPDPGNGLTEQRRKSRRVITTVTLVIGALGVVGSVLAMVHVNGSQADLQVKEATALSALKLSDRLLEQATKQTLSSDALSAAGQLLSDGISIAAPGVPKHVRGGGRSAELLHEADVLEAEENAKVTRVAAKLAQEEKEAQQVERAAQTLREEAKLRQKEQSTENMAAKLRADAEAQYKAAKQAAILKATKEIEEAEETREATEGSLSHIDAAPWHQASQLDDQSTTSEAAATAAAGDDEAEDNAVAAAADEEVGDDDVRPAGQGRARVGGRRSGGAPRRSRDDAGKPLSLDSDGDQASAAGLGDVVAKSVRRQQLGANGDQFLDLNVPPPLAFEYDSFTNLDPPGKPPKRGGGSLMYPKHAFQARKSPPRTPRLAAVAAAAAVSKAEVVLLEEKLREAKAAAARAEERLEGGKLAPRRLQHLAWDLNYKADPLGNDNYAPGLREGYKKGDLGPLAVSKWVPEDHPPSHSNCSLHDIDCDELWPWGKAPADLTSPPKRDGPLGDNLVGVFGQDDVVVPTGESGLIGQAVPLQDHFAKWPQNSRKNKDLLYGSGRQVLSKKFLGIGDVDVPLDKVQALYSPKNVATDGQEGLADLMFGSWNQGFQRPHNRIINKKINMFDQPYRQHMSVVDNKGHQVFKQEQESFPSVGDTEADDEGAEGGAAPGAADAAAFADPPAGS